MTSAILNCFRGDERYIKWYYPSRECACGFVLVTLRMMESPKTSMDSLDFNKFDSNDLSFSPSSLGDAHPLLHLKGYTSLQSIGHGAQGTMLSAVAPNGHKVAIKCFDLRTISDWKEEELFRREIETLKNIQVQGTPQFIDEIESDSIIYLVESYIDAPSLEKRLRQGCRYSFDQALTIYKNAARILQGLQSQLQPIIHRDLKPANILVSDDLSVSIVDFGVVASKIQHTQAMTFAGTAGYVAPEQLYGKVTPASDIFSLGATMLHLITGIAPCDMEMSGITPDIDRYLPSDIPSWFKQILKDSLAPDPKLRISTATQLLTRLNEDHNKHRFQTDYELDLCKQKHVYDPYASHAYGFGENKNIVYKIHANECNKLVAIFLCLFLGVFGAHRFYEGKTFSGIIYAMSFGLLGIGVFIDFLILLSKPPSYPRANLPSINDL